MKKSVIKIYFGTFFEIQKRFRLKFLHMKFQMALSLYSGDVSCIRDRAQLCNIRSVSQVKYQLQGRAQGFFVE